MGKPVRGRKPSGLILLALMFLLVGGILIVNNSSEKEQNKNNSGDESSISKKDDDENEPKIPNTSKDDDKSDEIAKFVDEFFGQQNEVSSFYSNYNYNSNNSNSSDNKNDLNNKDNNQPNNPEDPGQPENPEKPSDEGGEGDEGGEDDSPEDEDPQTPPVPEDPYIHEYDGPDEEGIIYMQNVTQEIVDIMEYDTPYNVVDKRNGKTYRIVKSYDDWRGDTVMMIDNLAIGSNEKPMLLTPKYSNVKADYVLPAATDYIEYDENVAPTEKIYIPAEDEEIDGYLYSPKAAVAGKFAQENAKENGYVFYNTEESICPKNWRLAADREDYIEYGNPTITNFMSEIWASDVFNESATSLASSTMYFDFSGIQTMQTTEGSVALNKTQEYGIRCVFGNQFAVHTNVNYDGNGGQIWSDVYDEYRSTLNEGYYSDHDNEYYINTPTDVIYGTAEEPDDSYRFIGWATKPDATMPDYVRDNWLSDSEYTEGMTLYAVWKENNPIHLTFNANGGLFDDEETVHEATLSGGRYIVSMSSDELKETTEPEILYYDDDLDHEYPYDKFYAEQRFLNTNIFATVEFNTEDDGVTCVYDNLWHGRSNDPYCDDSWHGYAVYGYMDRSTTIGYDIYTGDIGLALYRYGMEYTSPDRMFKAEAVERADLLEGDWSYPYHLDRGERNYSRFAGWATTPDATEPEYDAAENYTGTPITKTIDYITEDMTLYAVWKPIIQYVDFDYQYDRWTNPDTTRIETGEYYTFRATSYNRDGYTFLGWATDPNSTEPEIVYSDGIFTPASVQVMDDLKYYAVWKVNGPDYIYEYDGPDEEGVNYMHNMTDEIMASMNYDEIYTLVDKRNGKEYRVRKIERSRNGDYIEMLDNLEIGDREKDFYLTPKYTDIGMDYVLAAGTDVQVTDEEDMIDGYVYSPSSAIAWYYPSTKIETYHLYNAEESICPKGWRLPVTHEDYMYGEEMSLTDFQNEFNQMTAINENAISFASSTINTEKHPFYMYAYLAGHWNISYEDIDNTTPRLNVRCVYGKKPSKHIEVNFYGNGGFVYDNEQDSFEYSKSEYAYRLTLVSDPEGDYYTTYFPQVSHTDKGVDDDYRFIGWATNPDATEAEYGPYDELRISFDEEYVSYYAIWKQIKPLKIEFDANGGEYNNGETVTNATFSGYLTYEINQNYLRNKAEIDPEYGEWTYKEVHYPTGPVYMSVKYNTTQNTFLCVYGDYHDGRDDWYDCENAHLGGKLIGKGETEGSVFKGDVVGYKLWGNEDIDIDIKVTVGNVKTIEGDYETPHMVIDGSNEYDLFMGWSTNPNAIRPEYCGDLQGMAESKCTPITFIDEDLKLYAVWYTPEITMQGISQSTIDKMNEYETTILTDSRNNKDYLVQKVGNTLVMAQNLALGGRVDSDDKWGNSENGAYSLTPEDTNIDEDWMLPGGTEWKHPPIGDGWPYTFRWVSANVHVPYEFESEEMYGYTIGAAIADNRYKGYDQMYDIYNAEYSICPAGWHLPQAAPNQLLKTSIGELPTMDTDLIISSIRNRNETLLQPLLTSTFSSYIEGNYDHDGDGYGDASEIGRLTDTNYIINTDLTVKDYPFYQLYPFGVRCVYGESPVSYREFTFDFNNESGNIIASIDADDSEYGEYTSDSMVIEKISNEYESAHYVHGMPQRYEYDWDTGESYYYDFLGWSTDKNATEPEYELRDELYYDTNMTFYAVWGEPHAVQYTLTFDAYGGDDAPEPITVGGSDNYTVTIPDTIPTRDGFEFIGWTYDAEYPYENIKPGDNIYLEEDATLQAMWEKLY